MFQASIHNPNPNHLEIPIKINYSQGTDISEPLPLSKQISLSSCASSLSVSEDVEHSKDNELFARYLSALGTNKEKIYFSDLKTQFQNIFKNSKEQIKTFQWCKYEPINSEQQILEHFILNYLIFMGYSTSSNKRHFISRVKLIAGPDSMSQMTKVYRNLSLTGMNRRELRSFLVLTCRNGWQYFIRHLLEKMGFGKRFICDV